MTRRVALSPLRSVGSALRAVPKHVHRFHWAGDHFFGNGSLYACRCSVMRPGI